MTIHYTATRLLFRKDLIEPLDFEDSIEISTPIGTYRMTKMEFYTVFDNVVQTISYRERGVYHYPKSPEKAKQFLI